jgi:hypothetical protein
MWVRAVQVSCIAGVEEKNSVSILIVSMYISIVTGFM